jgi:hypothetical protein
MCYNLFYLTLKQGLIMTSVSLSPEAVAAPAAAPTLLKGLPGLPPELHAIIFGQLGAVTTASKELHKMSVKVVNEKWTPFISELKRIKDSPDEDVLKKASAEAIYNKAMSLAKPYLRTDGKTIGNTIVLKKLADFFQTEQNKLRPFPFEDVTYDK